MGKKTPNVTHCDTSEFFEHKNGGEGGIRTPGRLLYLRRFSKPLPSATQPPLRLHGINLNFQ